MTFDPTVPSEEKIEAQTQQSDKELNFRKQEQKFQRMIQERDDEISRIKQEAQSNQPVMDDDDDSDDEPYIDKRKLKKTLSQFEQRNKKETKADIQQAVSQALYAERKNTWIKSNPDFNDVMSHAQRLADTAPELAESILEMPDTFERQKLVYKNIKALKLNQEPSAKPSVQEKIDSNRRSPFYQPSGTATAPYSGGGGDHSPQGQKTAYAKMMELKSRLRLG